jgi:hypothetical protein
VRFEGFTPIFLIAIARKLERYVNRTPTWARFVSTLSHVPALASGKILEDS